MSGDDSTSKRIVHKLRSDVKVNIAIKLVMAIDFINSDAMCNFITSKGFTTLKF